jgi:hypothetical protein
MARKPVTKVDIPSKVLSATQKFQPVVLTLPEAHPRQYELINAFDHNPGLRFIAGACGTKFGKTYGCTIRLVKEAWENPRSLNWWVAPTFDQSIIALNLVKRLIPQGMYVEYKADRRIVILNPDGSERSEIQFKSGDNPDSLRGFAVNFFIIDEAARIPYESYESVLTTVTQTRGRGIVISTPNGRNWFHQVYQWGEKFLANGAPRFLPHQTGCSKTKGCGCPNIDPHPEWMALRMPTAANPHVPRESIEEARLNFPERRFKQEYLAEFLDDSAGVFIKIYDCMRGTFEQPQEGSGYIIGVDLAKHEDWTVLMVMHRERKHVVAFERFNRIEWEVQYAKIKDMSDKYNRALCVIDSTGIGDPIVETLRNGGVPVEPYKISSNIAKRQLIEKTRVAIERGKISYPQIIPLLHELEHYSMEITPTGVVRYSAPDHEHDDCVIALCLATWLADTEPFVYKFSSRKGI